MSCQTPLKKWSFLPLLGTIRNWPFFDPPKIDLPFCIPPLSWIYSLRNYPLHNSTDMTVLVRVLKVPLLYETSSEANFTVFIEKTRKSVILGQIGMPQAKGQIKAKVCEILMLRKQHSWVRVWWKTDHERPRTEIPCHRFSSIRTEITLSNNITTRQSQLERQHISKQGGAKDPLRGSLGSVLCPVSNSRQCQNVRSEPILSYPISVV
jgi:hypothetical protein